MTPLIPVCLLPPIGFYKRCFFVFISFCIEIYSAVADRFSYVTSYHLLLPVDCFPHPSYLPPPSLIPSLFKWHVNTNSHVVSIVFGYFYFTLMFLYIPHRREHPVSVSLLLPNFTYHAALWVPPCSSKLPDYLLLWQIQLCPCTIISLSCHLLITLVPLTLDFGYYGYCWKEHRVHVFLPFCFWILGVYSKK